MTIRLRVQGVFLLAAVVAAACSQGDGGGNSSASGGQAGGIAANGSHNTNGAGAGGSTGTVGSGGQHTGASGSVNNGGQGGSGGSAEPTAGRSNGGNGNGGAAGPSAGAAGANNAGAAGQSSGGSAVGGSSAGGQSAGGSPAGGSPDGGAMGTSLDDCFAGLRDGTGTYQDATKASMDSMYRFRLALETADRFGTSGTVPWGAYRFGIETPLGTVCVTDEAALAAAYGGTHHNCDDVFTWVEGGITYEIQHPDTAVDRPSSLSIYQGQTLIAGPIRLDLETCHVSTGPNGMCYSGGPC